MLSIFTVGVTVQLIDRVTGGLNFISNSMLAAGQHTNTLTQHVQKLQMQLMALQQLGDVGKGVMRGSMHMLQGMIDPAKEYVHQVNLMNMAGMQHLEIQKQIASAWDTSRTVVTSTVTENLKALGDMATILGRRPGDLAEGRGLLTHLAKMQAILRGSVEGLGEAGRAEDLSFSAVKATEMLLKMTGTPADAEQIKHHLEQMTRVMVATRGRVLPQDYQNLFQYARQAKLTLGDDFLYNVAPELILEMQKRGGGSGGAGGPGAMIAALFRLGVQGIMNKTTAANLDAMGLLKAPTLETTTTGTLAQRGLVGEELLAENPARWVNEILIPKLKQHRPDLITDKQLLLGIPQTFRGNQMAVSLIGELFNKAFQFEKFRSSMSMIAGTDELYLKSLESPANVDKRFQAASERLQLVFGKHVLPLLVPAMNALSDSILRISEVLRQHPLAAKLTTVGIGLVGLAGGLTALGASVGGLVLTMRFLAPALAPIMGALSGPGILAVISRFGMVGLAIAGVGAAAWGLWKAFEWGQKNTDLLKFAWNGVVSSMQPLFSLLTGDSGLAHALRAVLPPVRLILDLCKILAPLLPTINEGLNVLCDAIKLIGEALTVSGGALIDWVKGAGPALQEINRFLDMSRTREAMAVAGGYMGLPSGPSTYKMPPGTTIVLNGGITVNAGTTSDPKTLADHFSKEIVAATQRAMMAQTSAAGTYESRHMRGVP